METRNQSQTDQPRPNVYSGTLPDIAITMVSGREIYGAFSLIVDDVDSLDPRSILCETPELDGGASSSSDSNSQNSSSNTPLDSPGGPRERIRQIQTEAETRRGEFARLLEEHAQVVRKLKLMEAEEQSHACSGKVVGATHA